MSRHQANGTKLLGELLSNPAYLDLISSVLKIPLQHIKGYSGINFRNGFPVKQVEKCVQDLSSVCKIWDEATCMLTHGGATFVLEPRALRSLKAKGRALDLAICKPIFLREVAEKWGHMKISGYDDDSDEEGGSPFLEMMLNQWFDGEEDVFAEAAVAAYKSFLVVKCVETLARDRCAPLKPTGVPTRPAEQLGMTSPQLKGLCDSGWLVRCQPTQLIDVMWHTHMLYPRAYAEACHLLIGAIIDHDPRYRNTQKDGHPSKLVPKIESLFEYERLWRHHDDAGPWVLVDRTMQDFGQELWEELNDPGCG